MPFAKRLDISLSAYRIRHLLSFKNPIEKLNHVLKRWWCQLLKTSIGVIITAGVEKTVSFALVYFQLHRLICLLQPCHIILGDCGRRQDILAAHVNELWWQFIVFGIWNILNWGYRFVIVRPGFDVDLITE